MKHILTLAALVFATSCFGQEACFGQVEIQLEFTMLEGHPHTPRSTQIEFLTGDSVLAFEPIGFEDPLLGAGTPAFSSPYPFGFDTNCSDQGWIMNFGAVIEFEVTGYPSHFSIHTSFWDSYPASIIEVAIKSGNFWVPLGSVTYQGTGCGWYQYELPGAVVWGCTDEGACNFNSEANLDDESCEYGCLNCGPGTVWDESVQLCVVANPSDTDFDSCVGMIDLLDLLSVFGTCNETPWSCGDPLEYQGYDYETVQIGEQCWFAENCRHLPSVSSSSQGSYLEPHAYVHSFQGSNLMEAMEDPTYSDFGVLYNQPASVVWACPTSWHVPSDEDWIELELFLGIEEPLDTLGYRGTNQGNQLKASSNSMPPWNGTDDWGFRALPGQYRGRNGNFGNNASEGRGYYWSSTVQDDVSGVIRVFDGVQTGLYRGFDHLSEGFSVRCIQNVE